MGRGDTLRLSMEKGGKHMKKWAICAAGALVLGAGWAAAGGIGSDPAAKAVKEFYAGMDKDGVRARLESCAPLPKGSVHYLEKEYSGYPDWQAFRTVVHISDIDGGKRHHWTTVVVEEPNGEWKVVSYGGG